jgi:hypothetical protein
MEPLLENTQLKLRPYKKQETYKTLLSLLNPGMQRKVNSSTKRIVKRIIEVWWEKLCCGIHVVYNNTHTNSSPNLSHTSALSSCSTSSSEECGPSTPDAVDEISVVIPRKEIEKKILLQQENNTVTV